MKHAVGFRPMGLVFCLLVVSSLVSWATPVSAPVVLIGGGNRFVASYARLEQMFAKAKLPVSIVQSAADFQRGSTSSKLRAVVLREPLEYLPEGFAGSSLERFVRAGGIGIICLDAARRPDWFPDLKVVYSTHRPPKGKTCPVVNGDYGTFSKRMTWYFGRLYAPFFGLDIQKETRSEWQCIASIPRLKHEPLPFLLMKPLGAGRLYVTTAACGLIGPGWDELFFGTYFADSFVEFIRNELERPSRNSPKEAYDGNLLVQRLTEPLTVDGQLNEQAYARAAWSGRFTAVGKESTDVYGLRLNADKRYTTLQTRSALFSDGVRLYAAFKAPAPAGETCQSTGKWRPSDDFVELFLRPSGKEIYQLICDCKGKTAGFLRRGAGNDAVPWQPEGVQAAATIGEDGFAVEMSVPLAALGIGTVREGDVWTGNTTREGKTCGGLATWAPVGFSFGLADLYGDIVFYSRRQALERMAQDLRQFAGARVLLTELTSKGEERERYLDFKQRIAEVRMDYCVSRHAGQRLWAWSCGKYEPFTSQDTPDYGTAGFERLALVTPQGRRALGAFMVGNLNSKRLMLLFKPSGPLAGRLRFREVAPLENSNGATMYDPLFDLPQGNVLRMSPRSATKIWLDVDTSGLKPGTYDIPVRLHPAVSGFQPLRFTVSLRISPVSLIECTEPIWTYGMGFCSPEAMDRLTKEYHFNGAGATPNVFLPANGDFSRLDEIINRLLQRGVRKEAVRLLLWVDFQKKSHWSRMTVKGKNYYFGEPEWKREFGRRLLALREHMKQRGLTYKNYLINTIDEPNGDPNTVGTKAYYAIEGAKIVRSIDPNIRLFCNPWQVNDGYHEYYLKNYDVLVPNLAYVTSPELAKLYEKSGREVWSYVVLTKNTPPKEYRKIFWKNMKHGFNGPASFYDLIRNSGDGLDSYDKKNPKSREMTDYSSVYYNRWNGQYSSSLRMEAWYEGMVDLHLYKMAQRLAKTEAERQMLRELVADGNDWKANIEDVRQRLLEFCERLSQK